MDSIVSNARPYFDGMASMREMESTLMPKVRAAHIYLALYCPHFHLCGYQFIYFNVTYVLHTDPYTIV